MLFSIGIAFMIILVAGFWTYQGLYSSAIFFFECVIATLIAFGFYEPLNGVWVGSLGAGIGKPLAFAVLFLIPLAGMKAATDHYFRENLRFNVAVDRAVAGIFGLLSSLVLVGTALVGVQMLPIGSAVFGFERLAVSPEGEVSKKNILFKPDNFAAGLASMASAGSMSGSANLATAQPDMLMNLYGARSCVQTEDTHDVPADCIKINSYWETRQIDAVTAKRETIGLSRSFETKEVSGGKLLVFDIILGPTAGVKDKADIYFRLPQFRLIGPPPETKRSAQAILACGSSDVYVNKTHNWIQVQDGQARRLVRFDPMTKFVLNNNSTKEVVEQGKGYRICVAFEVPDDFEPWYLAYKNGGRCEINKAKMFKQTPPKSGAIAMGNTGPGRSLGESSAAKPKPKPGQEAAGTVGKPTGGATQIANATDVYVTSKIPVPVSRSESVVSGALKGGKLDDCHFAVELEEDIEKSLEVKEFLVPDGKKLVILDADKNQPLSMYGRALNFSSNVLAQVTLTTDKGETYFAQGFYAVGKTSGKTWVEIQYHPEPDVPERCVAKPKKITKDVLQSTPKEVRRFGYIFVVDPGVKITTFKSGGTGGGQAVTIEVP